MCIRDSREHRQKIELYQRAGVITVDMELSALFTVARVRDVRCAAIVAVSDELHGETWEIDFAHGGARQRPDAPQTFKGGVTFLEGMTQAARVALAVAQQRAGIATDPSP